MRNFLLIPVLMLSGSVIFAQEVPDPQIEEAVHTFFKAMEAGDTTSLMAVLPEDCIMKTIEETEGRVVVKDGDRAQFVSVVGKLAGKLDERVDNLIIHQDGPLATVWMEYEFFFDGEQHHCGVNAMTMVLREAQWQIIYICDTRRDCL